MLGFDTSSYLSDGVSRKELCDFESDLHDLAMSLRRSKIRRLGVCANNSLVWAQVDFACVLAGICLIPIPTFFSEQQRQHILKECVLEGIVTDDACLFQGPSLPDFEVLGPEVQLIDLRVNSEASSKAPLLPRGTGKVTFTSGSTGTPKGVCLSHEQLFQQASVLAEIVDMRAPKHLCILPMTTLLENVAGLYAPLLVGGEVVVPSQESMGFKGSALVEPKKLLLTLSEQKPNTLILIPQLLQLLVGAAAQGWRVPDSLQFVAVGGSRVSQELLAAARSAGIPAYEGYGLSECASVVSLNSSKQYLEGSCGKPLPNLSVSIVESEIVVSGNCMLGYMNDESSWYPRQIVTGDIGSIDEHGYLSIEGRKKNIIISSYGRNISPEWIESEILASPLIGEAVVLGDARPYCVALLWSASLNNPEDKLLRSWIEHVNKALPDYAQIRSWYLLPSPLQANSKLMTDNARPRREAIAMHFAQEIDALYSQNPH